MKRKSLLALALVAGLAGWWGWHHAHQPSAADVPQLNALLDFAKVRAISHYDASDTRRSLTIRDQYYCESGGQACPPLGGEDFVRFDSPGLALHASLRQRIDELGLSIDSFHIRYGASGEVSEAHLNIANRHLLWYVYSPHAPWVSSHPQLAVTPLQGPWYLEEDTDWN